MEKLANELIKLATFYKKHELEKEDLLEDLEQIIKRESHYGGK